MKYWISIGLGVLWFAGTSLAVAQPLGVAENGRKLAGQCRTCHGIDGYAKIPIAPHIGGEPESYIFAQLRAFRDGTRTHEMMSVVSKNLTDQQIADLAAWYSDKKFEVELTKDTAFAPETCISCHGVDGIATVERTPNLAGETNIYIDTQLKAFKTGKRTHNIMSEIVAEMDNAEIRAVADWYGSIKFSIVEN